MQLAIDFREPLCVEVDQVDLVDRSHEVLDAQQLCDAGMAARLPQHAGPRVDEQDRHMRVGGAGEHVAGVALVTGGVGQDVAATFCGEEPVGHVDGDALFAFGAQAIGKRGQIGHALIVGHGFQMVHRQAVGVVQQPSDERALAIVHRAGGGDTQQLAGVHRGLGAHQK
ncbi:Uncharacterised protein [Mycobacteroides abscessus subsp. massiliense]|nr:Uncharacterised protein [Mycobacteroides abscessus subsp. massiliense]